MVFVLSHHAPFFGRPTKPIGKRFVFFFLFHYGFDSNFRQTIERFVQRTEYIIDVINWLARRVPFRRNGKKTKPYRVVGQRHMKYFTHKFR